MRRCCGRPRGAAGCAREPREPLLTYFNGDHGLTVRYPAGWRTEQAEQDGVWYRYFLAPLERPREEARGLGDPARRPAGRPVEQYAQTYLAGNKLGVVPRGGAAGGQGPLVHLHLCRRRPCATRCSCSRRGQGLRPLRPGRGRRLRAPRAVPSREMEKSLTLERPAHLSRVRDPAFGFSLRVPPSWKETRRSRARAPCSCSSRARPSPPTGRPDRPRLAHPDRGAPRRRRGLEAFYERPRAEAGRAFQSSPTALGDERLRGRHAHRDAGGRLSRQALLPRGGRRGYSLTFEARDDVYPRVFRWYDLIASTLPIGSRGEAK